MEADLISSEAARRRFHPNGVRISSRLARFHFINLLHSALKCVIIELTQTINDRKAVILNMGETIFCIVIAAIFLLIGIYNLLIAILGLFPQCRATAMASLKYSCTQRNVHVKGGRIPVITDYTYQYTVNGRKYSHRGSARVAGKRVSQNAIMVYVKWFPRHAYPGRFTAINQWACGVSMFLIGLMFIAVIVFVP